MPPPSISANIIAGMELSLPCFKAPHMPQDFFTNFQTEGLTSKESMEALGS